MDTEEIKTAEVKTGPAKAETGKTAEVKTGPAKTETGKTGPAKTKPVKGKGAVSTDESPHVTYQAAEEEYSEVVLSINRCSKVVKGGRNFSFGALVVVGNRHGKVGYGYGKANEVADAIRKGGEAAKRNMVAVPRRGTTVPHTVFAKFSGSKVMIRPASEGTGLIAGSALRAVLGLAGVVDVLTKSLGSSNPSNLVKAAFKAISQMNSKARIQEKLGKI